MRPPLEKRVEQTCALLRGRPRRHIGWRIRRDLDGDAELDEFVDAVLDIVTHAAERLHDRVDIEAFALAGAQEAQNAGAKRRLHQAAEAEVKILRSRGAAGAGAARGEGHITHWCPRQQMSRPLRAGPRLRTAGNTVSDTAR